MHSPIILLQLDLVKQKRLILRAQVGRLRKGCWKDETSWGVALLFTVLDVGNWQRKGHIQLNRSHLSSEAKVVLNIIPTLEGILQYRTMRNSFTDEKQRVLLCLPAVDYQLSCIWLLPLVLSLHAIIWLYGDGSISKETTLEHFHSDICLTLENNVQAMAHFRMNSRHLTIHIVRTDIHLLLTVTWERSCCSSEFMVPFLVWSWKWMSSGQGTTKSFIRVGKPDS